MLRRILRKLRIKEVILLRECRRAHLPVDVGLTTYLTKIRYSSPVWVGLPLCLLEILELVQTIGLRIQVGLSTDHLPALTERRDKARELGAIVKASSQFYSRII